MYPTGRRLPGRLDVNSLLKEVEVCLLTSTVTHFFFGSFKSKVSCYKNKIKSFH